MLKLFNIRCLTFGFPIESVKSLNMNAIFETVRKWSIFQRALYVKNARTCIVKMSLTAFLGSLDDVRFCSADPEGSGFSLITTTTAKFASNLIL